MNELAEAKPYDVEGALALIDQGLGGLTERQLVSASEVTDLLLDVRSLLSDAAVSGPSDTVPSDTASSSDTTEPGDTAS